MKTISITAEASAAVEVAFPGDWNAEIARTAKTVICSVVRRYDRSDEEAARGETYSDVLLRLAKAS